MDALHLDLSKPPTQMTAPISTFTPLHTPLPVLKSYDEHGVESWADTEAKTSASVAQTANMLLGDVCSLLRGSFVHLLEVSCGEVAVKELTTTSVSGIRASSSISSSSYAMQMECWVCCSVHRCAFIACLHSEQSYQDNSVRESSARR